MSLIKSKDISIPAGGKINSSRLNGFFKNVVADLNSIFFKVTSLSSRVNNNETYLKVENTLLHSKIEELSKQIEGIKYTKALAGEDVPFVLTCNNFYGYPSGSLNSNKLVVSQLFRDISLPLNNSAPRFFHVASNTLEPVVIEDLSVDITGTFDADDDRGIVDHEEDGEVHTDGLPINAFNGQIQSGWVRRVEFEEYSDITEVMCEITVDLPEGSSPESNCIYIIPFPNISVDIVGVYTAPDLSGAYTLIEGFEEVKMSSAVKFTFPVQNVQSVKIRMRQRSFINTGNKKVFYYGAQEIGLSLLEWDKTYSAEGTISENNSVILYADAPTGFRIQKIKSLYAYPNFLLEDDGTRHVHIKIASDAAGSDVIWDSDSDILPQDGAGFSFDSSVTRVYFIITMNYLEESGGVSSPFNISTSPTLNKITFTAELEAV